MVVEFAEQVCEINQNNSLKSIYKEIYISKDKQMNEIFFIIPFYTNIYYVLYIIVNRTTI